MIDWFANLPISRKQILVLVIAGLVPMLAVTLFSVNIARNTIEKKVFDQLEAVRNIKADAVERYFQQVENQILTMAQSPHIVAAMDAFSRSFERVPRAERLDDAQIARMREDLRTYYTREFGGKYQAENNGKQADIPRLLDNLNAQAIALQHAYISANSHPLGEKHLLDQAQGRSVYHRSHNLYHNDIRRFLEKFGYYDIFLVDIDNGDIVYSVFKELDYATSLRDGPYADTNFAEAFREAAELDAGQFALKDYQTYTPSYEAPASFIAAPVFNEGRRIGVLVFQMPSEPINAIMTERSAMGESGETYLVGEDLLMRSDSYLDPQNHSVTASFKDPTRGKVDTVAVSAALQGKPGNDFIIDYNGNTVLSSYKLLDLGHFKWAILAEIDKAEAFGPLSRLININLILALVFVAAIVVFALYVSKTLSAPILGLSNLIKEVEETGNFKLAADSHAKDEIGQTARAFNNLLTNVSAAMSRANFVLAELGRGNFDEKIAERYPGQLSELALGVNTAVDQVREASLEAEQQAQIAQEKSVSAEQAAQEAETRSREALIIKQALDVSATSVMIADKDFNFIYQNHAAEILMGEVESDLRTVLPAFDRTKVLGSSLDVFYKNPSHQRSLVTALTETHRSELKIAGLTFHLSTTPIRDTSGNFLGAVIEWMNKTEELARVEVERRSAEENARIRQALDNSSTSTLIADAEHNVIYANHALHRLLQKAGGDLQAHFSGLDVSRINDMNLGVFARESALAETGIEHLTETQVTDIEARDSTFTVAVSPIVDRDRQRIGTVMEWRDRSEEVKIEQEIDQVIEQASRGDFDASLDLEGKAGFFFVISKGLNRLLETTNIAIADVMRIFSALAQGDLSQTIDRHYDGQFGKLKTDANDTVDKLRTIIGDISEASSAIARAAMEISDGMQSLGNRTEQQAASLEQTAASMEEMTSTVKQSEGNATRANDLANTSVAIARQGNEAVEKTAASMAEISQASKKISNIIGVIDEIAFQTNLLALNAAVEAARAGEQGRGFAVVASEVRNLAQRSASAAKEIKDLIVDSVAKVDEGTSLVENSDQTLKSIVSEIEQVSNTMDEILVSAREQSTGIEQVSHAVTHMDTMTQENAALVEEAMSASKSMSDQAHSLDQLVSFFRDRQHH